MIKYPLTLLLYIIYNVKNKFCKNLTILNIRKEKKKKNMNICSPSKIPSVNLRQNKMGEII